MESEFKAEELAEGFGNEGGYMMEQVQLDELKKAIHFFEQEFTEILNK